MAEIWTRATRQRQPQGAVAVNWANPISRGLAFCVVGSVPYPPDLVSGKLPTAVGATAPIPTYSRYGPGTRFSLGYLEYGRTAADAITTGTAFAIAHSPNNINSNIFGSGENVLGDGFELRLDNSVYINNGFVLGGNNGVSATSNSQAIQSMRYPEPIAFTWDGVTAKAYSKGILNKSTTSSFVATANANRITRMANRAATSTSDVQTSTQMAAAWGRVLSSDEIQSLTANPAQILATARRVSYFFPASGIPTLSAATAVSITSTTATPRVTVTF